MIDLNCDMGESFGRYRIGQDEAIFPFITSANIACGFHAGDPLVMRRAVRLAKQNGVAVGAHPGFPDLVGFGRREMNIDPEQLYCDLLYQIGALQAIAASEGVKLQHVKPHGALYNKANRDARTAEAVVQAISDLDRTLALYTLPTGPLYELARQKGLRVVREFFADRTYQTDGTLTPRTAPNALISDAREAARRVVRMLRENRVETVDGSEIQMEAETVCIHGDEPSAAAFAREIRRRLEEAGVVVKAIGSG
ncbi:MAG: LamB/YcsF family protein [Brevibacillus sp.]|nr:LamB/YcsF family protein [Brevibacillus sp.]